MPTDMPTFEFYCAFCDQTHEGMPSFDSDRPQSYHAVPEAERDRRCVDERDAWVIDRERFVVRAYLDLLVEGSDEVLLWTVWVALSHADYTQWRNCREVSIREHIGPFYGFLDSPLTGFENTIGLRVCLHLKNHGHLPWAELQPTSHPLSLAQHKGISVERVAELYTAVMHRLGEGSATSE